MYYITPVNPFSRHETEKRREVCAFFSSNLPTSQGRGGGNVQAPLRTKWLPCREAGRELSPKATEGYTIIELSVNGEPSVTLARDSSL